jgi:hypothetical protein
VKTLWTKKLRLLHSFPTPYYLHHSDKRLKNSAQIIFRPFWIDSNSCIFKIVQKPWRIWKNMQRQQSCAISISFQQRIICIILTGGLENKLKICFRRDFECLRFLKLNLNHWKFEKSSKMKKLRIFCSFPMVYYLHNSEK